MQLTIACKINNMRVVLSNNLRLLTYLFIVTIVFEALLERVYIPFVSHIDEVVLLIQLLIIFVAISHTNKISKLAVCVFLSILYFVLISLISGESSNYFNVLVQSVLSLKFFIFYIGMDLLIRKESVNNLFGFLVIVSFIGAMLSLALPSIFSVSEKERFISGLTRIGGFQFSPNNLAYILLIYTLLLMHGYLHTRETMMRRVIIAGSSILILLTGSRVALLVLLSSVGFKIQNAISSRLGKILLVMLLIAVASLFIIIFANSFLVESLTRNYEYLSEDSGYIRGMMLYSGLELAVSHFPFGTGAATFGTPLSFGSPVYAHVGLADTAFVQEMRGVYDSNFASVLGEYGVAGILIYVYLIMSGNLSANAFLNYFHRN